MISNNGFLSHFKRAPKRVCVLVKMRECLDHGTTDTNTGIDSSHSQVVEQVEKYFDSLAARMLIAIVMLWDKSEPHVRCAAGVLRSTVRCSCVFVTTESSVRVGKAEIHCYQCRVSL